MIFTLLKWVTFLKFNIVTESLNLLYNNFVQGKCKCVNSGYFDTTTGHCTCNKGCYSHDDSSYSYGESSYPYGDKWISWFKFFES